MGDYGKPPPDVQGMSTLKVDNLTYRTTCESLRKVFDKYGEIGDIYIPRDYRTKESRGFAFVRLELLGCYVGPYFDNVILLCMAIAKLKISSTPKS